MSCLAACIYVGRWRTATLPTVPAVFVSSIDVDSAALPESCELALTQVVTRILREIVDIQYGRRKDHAWSVPFETAAQKKGCATA